MNPLIGKKVKLLSLTRDQAYSMRHTLREVKPLFNRTGEVVFIHKYLATVMLEDGPMVWRIDRLLEINESV